MKINEIMNETTAGGIAGVAMPLGGVQRRPSVFGSDPSIYSKKKKRKKKVKEKFELDSVDELDVKTLTPKEIAKKHDVPLRTIMKQLKKGIKVELEHTTDRGVAKEIALDHLKEMPDYYSNLDNMEKGKCNCKDECNCKESKKKITEGVNFGAGVFKKDDRYPPHNGYWESLTDTEPYYDPTDPLYGKWDSLEEPRKNPKWSPDEEMHVTETTANQIAAELGFRSHEDLRNITIDEFIALTTQYLRGQIGKQSPEVPNRVEKGQRGATMISVGKPSGYFNEAIMHLNKIARLGKERGATHVWFA